MAASEWKPHLRLAIPLATQQLGFQLMGLVDSAMLGHYDGVGLAASGIGNNLLFWFTSLGMGVVMGLDTVAPQALGAGRTEAARRALDAGLRLAILSGLACTLLVLASPRILTLAGVAPDVAADARVYTDLRAIGVVPFLMSIALRSYLAAHNVTQPLVIAVVAGNLANALLDLVLIFGLGPIPALGVAGAAFATTSVQLATLAIYFAGVRAIDGSAPRPASTRADLLEILRHGLPISGHLFAEIGIFSVATVAAGHLGKLPAAAHVIALNLSGLAFSVALGIGSATSVRVGHAIGAGDRALARRRGVVGFQIGLVLMGASAIVFVALPGALASLFTDEARVVAATIPLLQIAALFQLSDGTQAIGAGALRGIGDNRATFIGNLLGHYAIGLPIALALAFGAGLGAPGLWWGLSAGLTATAIYLVLRFRSRTRPGARP
ncbi:MAG TPA: MATE family efflux transporter [Kofleriaceae bacterium]|jgi:MATE family multidrug resistance protein|nr:MATE family efflux transporter [Kofleriaceae bacterium]